MSSTVRIISAVPPVPGWTDRLSGDSWYHWKRLETLLRSTTGWKPDQVDSVAAESLKILRYLHDPLGPFPFQGRGLVVGYVQSGKTASYTAVAARAADAGYRLVIILSGIHDSLRTQTQNRLERELTGHQDGGVPPAARGRQWARLTTPQRDFIEQDPRFLQSPAPFLAVVKKNYKILLKLDDWLRSAREYLEDMPVLIIDDEADQASINTKGNRPPDPAVSEEREEKREAEGDPDLSPSKINGLIRSILKRTTRAAYIAYTATPFANIFINPEAVDREVGDDLFPKDFVVQLPRPEGYTGTEELFGVSAQGRNVLCPVPNEDVLQLKPPRRRRGAEAVAQPPPALPDSLADALLCFCLAGAVRSLRPALAGKSHTMLVHVSSLTDDQSRIAQTVQQQLEVWQSAVRQGQTLNAVFDRVWSTFEAGVSLPAEKGRIITAAIEALKQLVVLVLNSRTGENLEYTEKPGRHIVAIGGDRLSRGLTLEGLTISYFLRTANMCDTLLQMARWYGFRHGYEDLIRIWTTDGIARWFTELALVEQSLRDSIIALERAGRRPDQMVIRLRAHSELLLTARNKSGAAVEQVDSWSGEHPQTVLLPLHDVNALKANRESTGALLSQLSSPLERHGGFLFRDVDFTMICDFLERYQTSPDTVSFRGDQIAKWIRERAGTGELTDWAVFVASPRTEPVELGGLKVGLVRRKRISSESIGILIDPRHEGVDLQGGPGDFKRDSGEYDAEAMRGARPSSQGLLIIYPLDARHVGVQATDVVIAVALSLPRTSDGGDGPWIVNSMVSNG